MSSIQIPPAANRARIDAIRSRIDHPIVDADGHMLESVPMLFDTLERLAGPSTVAGLAKALPDIFTGEGSVAEGIPRGPWWPSTTDALYQATVMVPKRNSEKTSSLSVALTRSSLSLWISKTGTEIFSAYLSER